MNNTITTTTAKGPSRSMRRSWREISHAAHAAFPLHLGDTAIARDAAGFLRRARREFRDQLGIVNQRARHRRELEPFLARRMQVRQRSDAAKEHERHAHGPAHLAG